LLLFSELGADGIVPTLAGLGRHGTCHPEFIRAIKAKMVLAGLIFAPVAHRSDPLLHGFSGKSEQNAVYTAFIAF
jgi:hypothetical protein